MDDDPEVIRQQMEVTRSSLTDKIERLEQAVTDKVQTTTAAVTDTVESVREAVQDTVESVKGTVTDTVDSVRSSVNTTVESVKEAFDVGRYFREYPWAAFGAAVGAGFVGGQLLGGQRSGPGARIAGRPFFVPVPPSHNGSAYQPAAAPISAPAPTQPSRTAEIASKFDEELGKLKGMAVGAVFGLLRSWVGRSVPAQFTDQVGEVIDSVTRKLGGEPVRGDLLDSVTGWVGGGKTSRERDAIGEARVADRLPAGR